LQQWKKHWERCITSRGDYFEGENAYNALKWAKKDFIVKVRSFF
jgi:hypothetical protein